MTDTTVIEEGPVETPAPDPAPGNDLDQLLAEFDKGTAQPDPAPDTPQSQDVAAPEQITDQQLADIFGPDPRISELQGQVDSLRAEAHRAKEMEAFNSYADDLQKQMPEWVPSDYSRAKLQALAHDPVVAQAWDLRNVDRQAAGFELARTRVTLASLQQANPADPRIGELTQYAQRLEIAVNAPAILRRATRAILEEANKLPPPIDPDATQVRADVAWAVKAASTKRFAEPPPDLGKMNDQEFRRWKRENLGWE